MRERGEVLSTYSRALRPGRMMEGVACGDSLYHHKVMLWFGSSEMVITWLVVANECFWGLYDSSSLERIIVFST